MTRSQVRKSELGSPVRATTDNLAYKDELLGMEALVVYTFQEGILTSGAYSINDKHINKNLYIDDYNTIKRALISKYGPPETINDQVWRDDLYRDRPNDWGIAVSTGRLSYICRWNSEDTLIVLNLGGDNFEISLYVFYYSKQFYDSDKEEEKSFDKL